MSQNPLKLISLNTWGGRMEAPLLNFIQSRQDIDIFCLQEVYNKASAENNVCEQATNFDVFSQISGLLPNHRGLFRPAVYGTYGLAMFVHKNLPVVEDGDEAIYVNDNYIGTGGTHSRILQYAKIEHDGQVFTVINVHGLWNGMGKRDSEDRLKQSAVIKEFADSTGTPTILCGDFNLSPDTESLKILESAMDNQIKIHGVKSTRTSLYTKPDKFADYVFTSKDIVVEAFEVLPDEVSDHAALLLTYRLLDT